PAEVDPVRVRVPELRPGAGHRPSIPDVLLEHDPGDVSRGGRGRAVVLAGCLRFRAAAVSGARSPVLDPAEHADAAVSRDDDSALHPLSRFPVAGYLLSVVGPRLPG